MVQVGNTTNRSVFNTIGGNIEISGGVTFDPDLRTLTCISTGGPATTVTWTRDSTTVTEGTETVLNDLVTANYTHTLNVTTGGEYTCSVANSKPSTVSASIILGIVAYMDYVPYHPTKDVPRTFATTSNKYPLS